MCWFAIWFTAVEEEQEETNCPGIVTYCIFEPHCHCYMYERTVTTAVHMDGAGQD